MIDKAVTERKPLTNKDTISGILTTQQNNNLDMSDVEDNSHSSSNEADENEEVEERKKTEEKKKTMKMPKGFRKWIQSLQGRIQEEDVSRIELDLEEMKKLVRRNRGVLFAKGLLTVEQGGGRRGQQGWRIMLAGKVLQNANEKSSLMFLVKGSKDEGVGVHVFGNWEEGKDEGGAVVAFKRRGGKQDGENVERVEMARKAAKQLAADVFQVVLAKM